MRQIKREVKIGNLTIGGNHPIAVQTMLNVPVEDIAGNVAQAQRCEAAGCQILRVTCPTAEDAKCIEAVKNAVNIPIVADIHFDYRAALACAAVGVDKIRINPGNIGDDSRVKEVVEACRAHNIPIRQYNRSPIPERSQRITQRDQRPLQPHVIPKNRYSLRPNPILPALIRHHNPVLLELDHGSPAFFYPYLIPCL